MMSYGNEKQKSLSWNEAQLIKELTDNDPYKRHFGKRGKNHGKTKGAFGKHRNN